MGRPDDKPTSHDLIFKTACCYFFGDVIELTRPELARRLDLSRVEFLDQEAFSDFPEGERSIADLVAKVRLEDGMAPAFAALMKSDWGPVEKKLRCLRAISRADVDEARRYVLAKIVDIYVELDETEAERYAAEVRRESNKEVRHMVITWEDALAASKTEGKAEGKAEAARSHILRILRRRLSSVPSFVEAKLSAIDSVERLEEILDQAIVVSSTEELVLEP